MRMRWKQDRVCCCCLEEKEVAFQNQGLEFQVKLQRSTSRERRDLRKSRELRHKQYRNIAQAVLPAVGCAHGWWH